MSRILSRWRFDWRRTSLLSCLSLWRFPSKEPARKPVAAQFGLIDVLAREYAATDPADVQFAGLTYTLHVLAQSYFEHSEYREDCPLDLFIVMAVLVMRAPRR